MSAAESPLKDRMIFNVGARRSGTYWLQRIVTAHPDVSAVPSETHLFSHGIAPLFERFTHGLKGTPQIGKLWVDQAELLAATRDFCDRVLVAHLEPGASYLAERTPLHVLHLDLITQIYPDARVAHIIRDGRDVARSLVSKQWGPGSIEEAAEEWRDSVLAGRAAAGHGRYVEVVYERLLADPEPEIRQLFERLGLPVTDAALSAALSAAGEQVNLDLRSPVVQAEKWRSALRREELLAFDRVAGELLEELGYERATPPSRGLSLRLPGLRRRRAAQAEPAAPLEAPRPRGPEVTDARPARIALALLDELLDGVRTGDPARVVALLAPGGTVEHVEGAARREATGGGAEKLLTEVLRDDPARGGRQRRADVFVQPSTVAAMVAFELQDGAEAERIYILRSEGERISRLVVYQLPVRARSGRAAPASA